MLRLLLVRHGETAWNASGRYQGQMDIDLNAAGRQQAEAMAERLASVSICAIYTSDLSRAWETAIVLAERQSASATPDSRLQELNFGEWQGLTYREIAEKDPERLAVWNEDRVGRTPPGGESLGAMAERVRSLIEDVHDTYSDGTVALVSHGGTIRVILCVLLGHPVERYWHFEVDNTAIAEIEWRELGPVVVRWNDATHLDDSNRQDVF
ncbi:MAG: alpha-ribazole phosphatase [Anaerolineae bacterium]|nr:alpha-ribazole phosphatase [Anaerolineae bacterium]